MTEPNDPARVLNLLFDNLVAHRKHMIETLTKNLGKLAKQGMAIEQAANDADLQRKVFKTDLSEFQVLTFEIQSLIQRIQAADIQITNATNISRQTHKFFGTAEKEKKVATVTPIRTTGTTAKATGSAPEAGKVTERTNPGVERQRERKDAQNNK